MPEFEQEPQGLTGLSEIFSWKIESNVPAKSAIAFALRLGLHVGSRLMPPSARAR